MKKDVKRLIICTEIIVYDKKTDLPLVEISRESNDMTYGLLESFNSRESDNGAKFNAELNEFLLFHFNDKLPMLCYFEKELDVFTTKISVSIANPDGGKWYLGVNEGVLEDSIKAHYYAKLINEVDNQIGKVPVSDHKTFNKLIKKKQDLVDLACSEIKEIRSLPLIALVSGIGFSRLLRDRHLKNNPKLRIIK